MANLLTTIIETEEHKDFRGFITFVMGRQERIFLRPQILQLFRAYCRANTKSDQLLHESSLAGFVGKLQELFLSHGHVVLLYRYAIAKYKFYLVRQDGEYVEEIGLSEYLNLKDDLALERSESNHRLRLDFLPFYDFSPSIRDIRSVGNGIRFLNRYMSSNIFSRPEEWNRKMFKFLQLHQHNGRQLLVNGGIITNQQVFYEETQKLLDRLGKKDPETPFADVEAEMSRAGFEVGWGNTVGRIAKTLQIILDLINEPTDQLLEEFVSRVPLPLISRVAVISPHGWFGQTNAFGKPDTGGQVIYILDQVRALERHLQQEIALTGLEVTPKIVVLTRLIPEAADTTCNQRMEKIFYTDNGWILRVPFRDRDYNVVKEWVSRFKIWPYLETFADDAERELASEFSGRPDLIIGNYSDGNLVASLLSDRFDVIQCTIAHALEKTKYQFSDIRWSEYESDYSFSIQYTADLFSMNKSDFIIASTLQEIIGTEETMGQYESYRFFTMPDLYQVINGTNLFAPKFNVIPPGVDEEVYFPYYNTEKRIEHMRLHLEDRLFCAESEDIFGKLDDPAKPCIFTMARLDKIKNITGLIAAFGGSKKLRKAFNLVFFRRHHPSGPVERQRGAKGDRQGLRAYRPVRAYRRRAMAAQLQQAGNRRSLSDHRRSQGAFRATGIVRSLRPHGHRVHGVRTADLRSRIRRPAGDHRGRQKRLPFGYKQAGTDRPGYRKYLRSNEVGQKLLEGSIGKRNPTSR